MSASNWAVCPRCFDRALAESEARFQTAVEAYGQVSPEEYDRLRTEAQVPIDPDSFVTFREDYEIYGAKTGTIMVDYGGGCQECGLSISFKHEREFYTGLAQVESRASA